MAYYPTGWQSNQPQAYQPSFLKTSNAFFGNTGFTGGAYSAYSGLPPQAATLFNSGGNFNYPPGAITRIQDVPQYINNYQPYNPNSRPVQAPGSYGGQQQSYGYGHGAGCNGHHDNYSYQDSFISRRGGGGWSGYDMGYDSGYGNDYGYDNDYGYGGSSDYYAGLLDGKALADLKSSRSPSAAPRSTGSLAAILAALGGAASPAPAPAPAPSSGGLGDLNDLMAFLNGTSDSLTGSGAGDDTIESLLGSLGLNT